MKLPNMVVFGILLAALPACDAISEIQSPALQSGARPGSPLFNTTCTEEIAATEYGGQVLPDPLPIARNCSQEACQDFDFEVMGEGVNVTSHLDSVAIRCANNTLVKWPAESCWDCAESCAGSNCPAGHTCYTIPGSPGSDCRAFTCPAGYTLSPRMLQSPVCRREVPCPPTITASMEGPSKIQPGTQCTWTADASGGSGNYSYQWYNGTFYVGSGPSYTGGLLSGNINSQFWLRVVVWDETHGVGDYAEILVKESPTAPLCPS